MHNFSLKDGGYYEPLNNERKHVVDSRVRMMSVRGVR